MIHSSRAIHSPEVAQHYDELDSLYRHVWGEHLHHGLFSTGHESISEATTRLAEKVAQQSGIKAGDRVCDIGCGYGKTSRLLAESYHATVLGLTLSPKQLAVASQHERPPQLLFRKMDWLENDLPDDSFDHLISIESSEHMVDKNRFFSEARRVLKRGGSFVICAWLTGENPSPLSIRHLLEPICREGRLPSMGSESDYRRLFEENGFHTPSVTDLSTQVKRTWTLSLLGLVQHLVRHPEDCKLLLARFNDNAEFLKSLFRIRLAYEMGVMRYCLFSTSKA